MHMTSTPAVILQDVWKHYRLGEVFFEVLRGVDLVINRGEFVIVMGPSGSGKSTLLSLIGGLERPSEGVIQVLGRTISRYSDSQLKTYRRKLVGFVFQFYSLVPTLTSLENVTMMLELLGSIPSKTVSQIAREMLELVGLGDRLDHFPSQLSGGERQRVAIVRALAKGPQLLLCDEPTGQLDANTSQEIISLIKTLSKRLGITTIMVTHDKSLITHADRVVYLRDGRIITETVSEGGFQIEKDHSSHVT